MAAHNRRQKHPDDLESRGIVALLEQGMTRKAIAAHFAVHKTTVDSWCQKHQVSTGRTGPRAGSGHRDWNGGRVLDKHGYVLVWAPFHPHARQIGYVAEHRLLAETLLFRYLQPQEVVDHVDEWPYHNWPDNLRLFPSNADHLGWTTGNRARPSPRVSIPGAYRSPQKLLRCPDESDTLAQCPEEIRQRLAWYIDSHRPRIAHRNLSRRAILRAGAWRNPFPAGSRASSTSQTDSRSRASSLA